MSTLRLVFVAAVATIAAACSSTPSQPPAAPAPAPAPAPGAVSVAGTWELTVESPMGSRTSDAVFTQNGETLGGKMVSQRGEAPLQGTIKGDTVAFNLTINAQGQDLTIDYSGKVTGDTMSGTVQFGSFGDGKWTGKRKSQ
jgi:hypothetical protein